MAMSQDDAGPSKVATGKLAQLLIRVVRRHASTLADGPLVLAVSGGPDSLAMLFAAVTAGRGLRREVVVAHFSHGMRHRAERGEAALVRRVARRFDLAQAHEQGAVGRSEASARDARYAFLARVASEYGGSAVLTAHTQDDQAETLLLRLIRGSGLRGAGAVRELSHRAIDGQRVALLRPLLTASRGDTLAACSEWDVKPASDGTNRSLRFARNRVRHRVLDELAQINPQVRAALATFARNAQADEDLLASLARDVVAGDERRESAGVTWSTRVLASLPEPLLARVVQAAWASLRGEGAAMARTKIDAVRRVIARGTGSVELIGGARVIVEQSRVTMSRATVAAPTFAALDLPIPGMVSAGGWRVTARVVEALVAFDDPLRVMIDADAVGAVLCVRPRLRGDRFQPLGMASEVRLQDVLVNAKVHRTQRDGLPLVVGDRGIAWVAGVRIAEWAKVTPNTRRVVEFAATRLVDAN